MAYWKIRTNGFTTIELLIAISIFGVISIMSLQLFSFKKEQGDNAIVRTRELSGIVSNLRLLKKDIVYAQSISRDVTDDFLIINNTIFEDGSSLERTIIYKIFNGCSYGRGEKSIKENNRIFSCLQRTVLDNGIHIKSMNLNAIKNFRWCLTSKNCNSYLDTNPKAKVDSPITQSGSMIKLQIYDYKGSLIKMILALSNVGSNNVPKMDIIHMN